MKRHRTRRARGSALVVVVALLTVLTAIKITELVNSTSASANEGRPASRSGQSAGGPASGSGIATPAPSPTTPSTATAAAVSTEVAQLTAALPTGGVSIDALNTATGASFRYGATSGMNTGSIIKLDIIETLLLQHQDTGTPLSAAENSEATTMIENSDNDSAQDLWVDVGSDQAVALANKTLGPTPDTVPGTDDYWGLTTTDAPDQVTLLKNLVSAKSPLDAASQEYVLSLMRQVEADQRWGVGVIADPGTTFANKNGWLAVDADNDLWLVNSDGIVTVDGQQVLISVLTQHDSDFDTGIDLVQALARAVVPAVVLTVSARSQGTTASPAE
jgi:hypothetical protein